MNIQTINNKEIFICDSHNEAIEFWAKYQEFRPYLLSFDHHTDTRPAFNAKWGHENLESNLGLIERLRNGEFDLISELRHDEQIDAAIQCNFINKALIICFTQGSTLSNLINVNDYEKYDDSFRIIVNPHNRMPDMSIETNLLSEKMKLFERCIKPDEWNENYILDIDLDFFYKRTSLKVKDDSFFKEIVKNAKAISITREEKWIEKWRKDHDETITVAFLESKLLEIIHESK